ncbi:MAG TPA: ATP synthase F1 subunit delta [Flavobacterium sp.]|jgi:F-type H+-transporting ATPase subunit delta
MSRAAIRYAKAMLEQAETKGAASEVNNDMQMIVSTVVENRDLEAFLRSSVAKPDAVQTVLLEIFDAANSLTKSLFRLLADNKRFDILPEIATEYNRLFEELNGVEVAKVTTAIPMDEEMESQVLAKIRTFSDKNIVIENIVEPAIIGGFILRIGDRQYNASVANRLKALKRELAN